MQRCLLRNHLGTPYSARKKLENATELTEGLGDDVSNLLNFSFGEFAGTLGGVDLCDTENEEGEAATETLDDTETESSLMLTVDVGVLHTQNVLEIVSVRNDKSGLQTGYQAMPRERISPPPERHSILNH
jgi:hypothetical protein